MFNIVLVNPQIPNNTGAIGRLCVNTSSKLHIIKPIGFDISEKAVRRAGLDYWSKIELYIWDSLDEFLSVHSDVSRYHLATTKTNKVYFDATFHMDDYIFFGSETAGLPKEFLEKNIDRAITIPMGSDGRSLNLAMSAGIVLYDAIRQNYNSR